MHYKKLVERKKHILSEFKKYDITNFEIYDKYDRREITKEDLDPYFAKEFNSGFEIIVKCITLNHYSIYNDIVNNNIDVALILEDDARFVSNFKNILINYLSQLPDDLDMAFINAGCGQHVEKKNLKPNQIWYEKQTTRSCCAYLITKKYCETLIKTMIPIKLGIDIELNNQILNNKFKVYWCEPNIVIDGSEFCYPTSRDEEIKLN